MPQPVTQAVGFSVGETVHVVQSQQSSPGFEVPGKIRGEHPSAVDRPRAEVIPQRPEGAKPWQWAAAPKDGFHVLRHTNASMMLEAGESVVTLAQWLGHSSPSITLGYYAHFMPEAGNRGRAVIDGFLGEWAAGQNSPDSPQS